MYTRPDPKPVKVKKAPHPLQRSRMRRRTSRRVKAKTADERKFLSWLHRQVCAGWAQFPSHFCDGPIQAAHFRNHTGTGRCEPYDTCIPLCRMLHDEYDGRTPPKHFAGKSLEDKKAWHVARQEETRRMFAESLRRWA